MLEKHLHFSCRPDDDDEIELIAKIQGDDNNRPNVGTRIVSNLRLSSTTKIQLVFRFRLG